MRTPRANFTLFAALAAAAVLCMPAVAAAAPAKEEYRLKYPDATGKGSGGSGGSGSSGGGGSAGGTIHGVGPRGASAKGFAGKGSKGGSGKGKAGNGGFAGATSGKADTGEVPGTTAGASETVPQIAADQASLGGLPVLLIVLGITSAGAIGFAGWRRLRDE